ncbi:MAG TPA: SRPBCC family protein [Noviherbaspirillum sp.]|nr:SRPBCC family protein [Noviherbaspirillum sp.]
MKHKTRTEHEARWTKWLGGAAVGALAMYFSDPERGRRRRALTRDKMQSLVTQTGNAMDVARRDLGNRVQGLRARAFHLVKRDEHADDPVLAARVRARIGRAVSHPHPIHVAAHDSCVTLTGPILASEHQQLIKAVRHVHGVREVEDMLTVHENAEGIPALQGNHRTRESAATAYWPPGLRALATAGGGFLALYGLRRRGAAGTLLGTAGLGLLARSLTNRPLFPNGAASQSVHLTKTLHISASPERVYDMWSDYKHFPYFMSHVKEVRDLGDGRSHWTVTGPAGMPIEWTARMTEQKPMEKLAWHTEEDAPVKHSGEVHFEPEMTGTRVTVHLSYQPPAGAVGHVAASLLGASPKRQMDDDLMRMKSYIEQGIAPHDAAKPFPPLGEQVAGVQ